MIMRMVGTTMMAIFLLSLSTVPVLAADARGDELVKSLGCKGCHQLGGSGGTLGPALDTIGKRMEKEQLRKQLLDPKALNAKSMMPSYQRLSPSELQALVDYLDSLK
ncbi:MAG: c-type cytochrome [Desulfuromonadales bacterium]